MRQTEKTPTKSGVIGLLAAAQGLERDAPLGKLASLRFGARADVPGRIVRDFQTARTLDGKESMPLSQRYYLSDATFLVGLESEDDQLLEDLVQQLRAPVFPLYLGRRSCPPSGPIRTEIYAGTIEEAFAAVPLQARSAVALRDTRSETITAEVQVDSTPNEPGALRLRDVPICFAPEHRQHEWREVNVYYVDLANPFALKSAQEPEFQESDDPDGLDDLNQHDIFAAFNEEG